MKSVSIFGVVVRNTTLEETTAQIEEYLDGDSTRVIFTPNTEIVMAAKEDIEIRDLVNSADIVVPDGIGLIYASRIHKKPLQGRVTGYDLSLNMLKMGKKRPMKFYFLGGKDGVAKKAKENVEAEYSGVEVVGYHHGYFKGSQFGIEDDEVEKEIINEINELKPDVVFVGFGFPRQEIWINHNRDRLNAKVLIGNGGVMDILAGELNPTPEIFVKLNLEWFYRLMKQPSRIVRQMALPKFLISVLLNKDSVKSEGKVMNKDALTVNAIRFLSVDAVEKANSGHPGLPLGAAPMAYTLWGDHLNINPKDEKWFNRDRFVLSAGHGSSLLYSLLHLYGYNVTIDDIKNFRQLNSITPGHPEYGMTSGVDSSTGPLGQGISMAVGMAMAETHLAAKYNRDGMNIVDHYTYALCGDGDLMEGIGYEACSLAGTLKLGKLIVLYDSNSISIEGRTDIAFTENVIDRFKGFDWQVLEVEDGNDIDQISIAVELAKKETERPTIIKITTKIGYGSPKVDQAAAHGAPLGEDGIADTRAELKWNYAPFEVPAEVYENTKNQLTEKEAVYDEWKSLEEKYSKAYPELYSDLMKSISGELPDNLFDEEFFKFDKDLASRAASGISLNRIAEKVDYLFGGSADLGPSNQTEMKNTNWYSAENRIGKNIHFGVREHAMAAIGNGISLHGGLHPYVGTFLVFSDYMKGAIRLSSLMEIPMTYILTHDSIGVGEDGPTHQPIEHLAMLRSIPNMITYRPADAKETAIGWKLAMESKHTPVSLILSRQTLPNLEGSSKDAEKGAYVISRESDKLDLILLASGSEVSLALEAKAELEKAGYGVRVVSVPSMELFEAQSSEYRESVIPADVRNRISIEAASTFGWGKYVGLDGQAIGIDTFGASGPAGDVYKHFNITSEHIVQKAKIMLK